MSSRPLRNLDFDTALAEARARYAAANPESRRQFEYACRSMPGGNTRSGLYFEPFPLTLIHGQGARVRDLDGHEYIDFLGDYGAGLFGHSHPATGAALKQAVDDGLSMGAPGLYEARLAEILCARFPSIDLVRFCNSGTEANLFALLTALAYTGRKKILAFAGGYHGGALSFDPEGRSLTLPFPFVMARYNDTDGALALIERHAGELAAIILEPMQSAGGCIPAEPDFLAALRRAADRHGIVLVFDEVVTSRLSAGGLQAALDVVPDMTALGKYVGGGSSFGAFGGRREIMARFDPRRPDAFQQAGTFNNDRLTMAAGYAAMANVYTPEVADAFNARGERLRARLGEVAAAHDAPIQITGMGSAMNLHFSHAPVRTPEDAARGHMKALQLWHLDMLARGQHCAPRGSLFLSLPLGEAELEGLVAAFDDFLGERGALLDEI